jgi:protein SCO1/2
VKGLVVRLLLALAMAGTAVGLVFVLRGNLFRPQHGGDFTLQSADGPVSLAQYRGSLVMIYFGYTFCPDACPTSLANMSQALKALTPEELNRVHGIFISVDPERDTVSRLKTYAGYFHPRIVGVTGDSMQLALLAAQYGASFQSQKVDSKAGYLIDHTSEIYLVDRDGSLIYQFPHGTRPVEIVATLREFMNSKQSNAK